MTKPFDPTKPVQTRDGRKVRILCIDRKDDIDPIVGLVDDNGRERISSWRENGKYYHNREGIYGYDLVNIPEHKSAWGNVYSYGSPSILLYGTKEDATIHKGNRRGLVEIIYEDDEIIDVKLHKEDNND